METTGTRVGLGYRKLWDTLGVSTTLLCAAHCLVTPLLLASTPVLAEVLPGDEVFHRFLAALIITLSLLALPSGYRRHGRRLIPLVGLLGVGAVVFAGFAGGLLPSALSETTLTLGGGLLLAVAHILNRTFCRLCDNCSEDSCHSSGISNGKND